jgi:RNA polymerase sigma-70 factor (ECF subfamily)
MTSEIWKKLVKELGPKIFRLAKRITNNTHDAEDISQDVLLKLYNNQEQLEKISSLPAYVLTMTRNLSIDLIRKQKVKAEVELVGDYEGAAAAITLPTSQKEEAKQIVNMALNTFDEPAKSVIQLREIEGLAFAEIAQITGLSEGNIRVILSRSRKMLKEKIEKLISDGRN